MNTLLFDVDGTLISTSAGRTALERLFESEFGSATYLDFPFSGMTDPAILRIGIERAVLDGKSARVRDEFFEPYLAQLVRDFAEPELRYDVLPGVHDLLESLRGDPSIQLGLGTGNLERAAEIKLQPAGLWETFSFGGYGSDAEDRAELIRIGFERGERAGRGTRIVIGDTPKDIAAARANDAFVVAVATGRFEATELQDADLVVETLEDSELQSFLRSPA